MGLTIVVLMLSCPLAVVLQRSNYESFVTTEKVQNFLFTKTRKKAHEH